MIGGIVGGGGVFAGGFGVVGDGVAELLSVVVGVAYAVVGIGALLAAELCAFEGVSKRLSGVAPLAILELGIAEVVPSEVAVGIAGRGAVEVVAIGLGGGGVASGAILEVAEPEVGLPEDAVAVVAQGDGVGEVLAGRGLVAVARGVDAEVVEHILLGFEHLVARLLDVGDAGEGLIVVVAVDIGLRQVVLHLALIAGVGIEVEKLLKVVDGSAEGVWLALLWATA